MITEFIANVDAGVDDGHRELLLQQLQLEYQADRMPGYAIHLEQVDTEVFGRHRDYYVTGLGFDPADVIRATRRHTRSVNQEFGSALDALTDALNSSAPNTAAGEARRKGFDAITLWDAREVAASTGIAWSRFTAMLDVFSACGVTAANPSSGRPVTRTGHAPIPASSSTTGHTSFRTCGRCQLSSTIASPWNPRRTASTRRSTTSTARMRTSA